jgi:nucleotide-binding universal stress UspA family protein
MPFTVLLCTDGSELSRAALAEGLRVLAPAERIVVATVVEPLDPTLVVGAGMAGGVMSPSQAQREHDDLESMARDVLDSVCADLDLADAERVVQVGPPGPTLCELADALPASVLVIGTRGHGGLRRAVLGSVSDYVVRHAPCPVVTRNPSEVLEP